MDGITLLVGLIALLLPQELNAPADQLTRDDLFDVYVENQEAIDAWAETLEGDPTDREIIEGWLNEQPVTYSGRWRDRREERRKRRESEPEEQKDRRRRFDPDKPGIIEGIRENKKLRIENRKVLLWILGAVAVVLILILMIISKFK